MSKRVPIKIRREAIVLSSSTKMKLKLWELQENTKIGDILEMSEHFNMLARELLNIPQYNSLPLHNEPWNHRNWVHFERIWQVCRMKDWSTFLYLESQFHRARNWTNPLPQPSMMYSVNAMRHFTNYLSDIRQKYEKDIGKRKKEIGRKTQTSTEEIVEGIASSIETLSNYMRTSNHKDMKSYKVSKLFQSWNELSPYYMWSIPWFRDLLPNLQEAKAREYQTIFNKIDGSEPIIRIITTTVEDLEEYFNVPPNIQI